MGFDVVKIGPSANDSAEMFSWVGPNFNDLRLSFWSFYFNFSAFLKLSESIKAKKQMYYASVLVMINTLYIIWEERGGLEFRVEGLELRIER